MYHGIKSLITSIFKKKDRFNRGSLPKRYYSSGLWDTKTAIDELVKIAKRNTQDYEIFLALGNLYRFQGDIDKAIRIRHNLISKPYLDTKTKGRIFFELGMDYKRGGFFDRALFFLEKSRSILGEDPAILTELMELSALVKEFEKSAFYSKLLKNPIAYAHFKVQQSKIEFERGNKELGEKLLKEAIETYPASVEGWSELIKRDYDQNLWEQLYNHTKKGLKKVSADLKFVIIEELIQYILKKKKSELFSPNLVKDGGEAVIKAIKRYDKDPVLLYYLAWFYLQVNNKEKALESLKKSVFLDPNFWLARIELLQLMCDLTKVKDMDSIKEEILLLVKEGRNVKRFMCNVCSFKTNTLFFVCPRCNSWHSIRFKRYISG